MRYRRKAEVVEAWQLVVTDRDRDRYVMEGAKDVAKMNRTDLMVAMLANPGDWLVRHSDGRLKALTPAEFAAAYEPVGERPAPPLPPWQMPTPAEIAAMTDAERKDLVEDAARRVQDEVRRVGRPAAVKCLRETMGFEVVENLFGLPGDFVYITSLNDIRRILDVLKEEPSHA